MAGSLDDLIEFLLEEIALGGEAGLTFSQVVQQVQHFYQPKQQQSQGDNATHNVDTTQHPSVETAVDRPFLSKIWKWLSRHPDVSVGNDKNHNIKSLEDAERLLPDCTIIPDSTPTTNLILSTSSDVDQRQTKPDGAVNPSKKADLTGRDQEPRFKVNRERISIAICGHLPDPNRIVAMEWTLLLYIAAARKDGILQGELTRLSGQDKRSVPKRTDALQLKGYIVKQALYLKGNKTSKLYLRRYAAPQHPSGDPGTQATTQVTVRHIALQIFDLLKNNPLIPHDDLGGALAMTGPGRARILLQLIRHFSKAGCLKRVKTAFKPSAKVKDLKVCIQYLKEPSDEDWKTQDGPPLDLDQPVDTLANLYEAENGQVPSIVDDDANDDELGQEEDLVDAEEESIRTVRSPLPQWNPDRVLANVLFEATHDAGPDGLKNTTARKVVTGPFVKRTLESLLVKISNRALQAQPPGMRHLAIVRTHELVNGVQQYLHYTFGVFAQKVESGQAKWEDISGVDDFLKELHKAGKDVDSITRPEVVDKFGFPVQRKPDAQVQDGAVTMTQLLHDAKIKHTKPRPGEPALKELAPGKYAIVGGTTTHRTSQPRPPKHIQQPSKPPGTNAEGTSEVQNEAPTSSVTQDVDIVADDNAVQMPLPTQRKSRKKSPDPEVKKGRPRKFTKGTEAYWRSVFQEIVAEKNPHRKKHDKAGVTNDPAALKIFHQRPADFDQTVLKVIEQGLPAALQQRDISQEWIDNISPVINRSEPGLYVTPTGFHVGSRLRKSKVLILRSSRLSEINWSQPKKAELWQFLSSSASHSFRLPKFFPKSRQTFCPFTNSSAMLGTPVQLDLTANASLPSPESHEVVGGDKADHTQPEAIAEPPSLSVEQILPSPTVDTRRENRATNSDLHDDARLQPQIQPSAESINSEVTPATTSVRKLQTIIIPPARQIPETRPSRKRKPTKKAVENLVDADVVTSQPKSKSTRSSKSVPKPMVRTSEYARSPSESQTANGSVDPPVTLPGSDGDEAAANESQPSRVSDIDSQSMSLVPNDHEPSEQNIDLEADHLLDLFRSKPSGSDKESRISGPFNGHASSGVHTWPVTGLAADEDLAQQGSVANDVDTIGSASSEVMPTDLQVSPTEDTSEPVTVANTIQMSEYPTLHFTSSTTQQTSDKDGPSPEPIAEQVDMSNIQQSQHMLPISQQYRDDTPGSAMSSLPDDSTLAQRERPREAMEDFQFVLETEESIFNEPSAKRLKTDQLREDGTFEATRAQVSKLCRILVLEMMGLCSGILPNVPWTLRRTLVCRWEEAGIKGDQLTAKNVRAAIKALCESGKLKQISFAFRGKDGTMVRMSVITLQGMDAKSPVVLNIQQKMREMAPADYVPPELEAESHRIPNELNRKRYQKELLAMARNDGLEQQLGPRRQPRKPNVLSREMSALNADGQPTDRDPTLSPGLIERQSASPPPSEPITTANTGFLTLKVPRLKELNLPAQAPYRYKASSAFINLGQNSARLNEATPKPAPKKVRRDGAKVVWKKPRKFKLPSSIDDVPNVGSVREAAALTITDDSKTDQFEAEVDRVASWEEENLENLADTKVNQPVFINHGLHIEQDMGSFLKLPTINFEALVQFNEDTHEQRQVSFPPNESWLPFVQSLAPKDKSANRRAKRPSKRKADTDADWIDDSDFEPKAPKKRKLRIPKSRPRKPVRTPKNVEDLSSRVPFKRNRVFQVLRRITDEQKYQICVAIVVVRTLIGGIEKFINWNIVRRLVPDVEEEILKESWKSLGNRYRSDISGLTESLQNRYLDALIESQVPSVNFDNIDATDWQGIFEWSLANLDKSIVKKIEELPAVRGRLFRYNDYAFNELKGGRDLHAYNVIHTVPRKEEIVSEIVFGTPVRPTNTGINPLGVKITAEEEEADPELSLAKSWIMATLLTPEANFSVDKVQSKLLTLAPTTYQVEALLEKATKSLQRDKILSRTHGKPGSGPMASRYYSENQPSYLRCYEASLKFFEQFEFRRLITTKMLRQAATYKLSVLDTAFKEGTSITLSKDQAFDDGEMVAILNLASMNMLAIRPGNDVPASRWGLEWQKHAYSTRMIDKSSLGFTVILTPTPSYTPDDPWSTSRNQASATIPRGEIDQADSRGRIPLWFDILHNFQPNLWEMVLGAVLGLVSSRPGIGAREIARTLWYGVSLHEVEMVLEWAGQLGLVGKTSAGCGWETRSWWWMGVGVGGGWRVDGVDEGVDELDVDVNTGTNEDGDEVTIVEQ